MLEPIEQLALPGFARMVGFALHRLMNAQSHHAFPHGLCTFG
jgi:hypothetical protein